MATRQPQKTDVARVEPAPLARPDWIADGDVRGTEHITREDMQTPRLLIAQGMSPQIVPEDPRYIDGLKIGDMFNQLNRRVYGPGPLEFTVIRADRPRAVEFYPLEEGGGVKDPNVPLTDPRAQFSADGKKPAATKYYDYVIMLLPSHELIALSFKSTGINMAKHLNTLMRERKVPCFAGKYTLRVVRMKNARGSWPAFSIDNSIVEDDATASGSPGWVSKEVFVFAAEVFDTIKDRELVIDREPETPVEAAGGVVDNDEM